MQFGSKTKRDFLTNAILGFVPDVLIAGVAAHVTESAVIGFFAVLAGLQVLYFLIWAKRAIWAWLLFWIRTRRQMADHALDVLRADRYPEPDEYHGDVEDYFRAVTGNQRAPLDVRLKAANALGALDALRGIGQATLFLQVNLAYEGAILRYKRQFPPRNSKDDQIQADSAELFE